MKAKRGRGGNPVCRLNPTLARASVYVLYPHYEGNVVWLGQDLTGFLDKKQMSQQNAKSCKNDLFKIHWPLWILVMTVV